MARIVGVFANNSSLDEVVEQLQFNNITDTTVIAPDQAAEDTAQQIDLLHLPPEQSAEYHRRLHDGRWLLIVQTEALMLPTVQRALRAGQAIDVDLLPEPGLS